MPTFPFNQTDIENLYNQNILNVTQIDSKLDLVRIDINKLVSIMNQNNVVNILTQDYNNVPSSVAINNFANMLTSIATDPTGYIILSSNLICSPRPQSLQTDNDFCAYVIYSTKL
jgi:hypothetical protein